MLKALVITGVLAIFFGIQLVQSLDCFHCVSSGSECTNVTTVTCNQTVANETNIFLSRFKNVPNVTSNNFECIWYNHTLFYNDVVTPSEIRSCAYMETDACSKRGDSSRLFVGSVNSCMSCKKNLCNKSPAAIAPKSFLTLAVVCVCLLAMKLGWN